jgi:hypothetical protein
VEEDATDDDQSDRSVFEEVDDRKLLFMRFCLKVNLVFFLNFIHLFEGEFGGVLPVLLSDEQ